MRIRNSIGFALKPSSGRHLRVTLRIRNSIGFTLIEVLIVSALVAGISLAIYSSFVNGLKVWEAAHRYTSEEDIVLFFNRFEQRLKNSFPYSQIEFEQDQYHIEFPTILHVKADSRSTQARDEYVDQIGKVKYTYDVNEHTLVEQEANYAQALRNVWGTPRVLVRNVRGVRFGYIADEQKRDANGELELGNSSGLVSVEVRYEVGKDIKSLEKFIDVPIGS